MLAAVFGVDSFCFRPIQQPKDKADILQASDMMAGKKTH